ncbi:hypothetical protein [Glaciihabitans arcticus]|uniref:hypothetical protein n=1 Tax=Glaciihabitans arcticus TaxID=2668039 RepID=UPI00138665F4|nr:hypothetical protein [Glaciihabitans arcticus]
MRSLAIGIAVLLLLTACAPAEPTGPLALTGEQSERLAIARFRNFDAGVRAIDVTVPADSGELELVGWFDYAGGVGYAAVSSANKPAGLIWWTHELVATRSIPVDSALLPLPADGWESGPLDPSSTSLANAVAVVASLGSDRPENPQLLAQTDAAWLRTDEVDGVDVDVFIGPSGDSATSAPEDSALRARYWLDDSGLLLTFQFPAGSSGKWMTALFGPASGIVIPSTVPGTP